MTKEELEKENAELKAQISVLLSCENCPENKGGYICEKEYNDKCLAQKIQYIKELEQENAELKELLKEAVQLLKNSDELYGYQIRDFQVKCKQFTKESE
jgi:translation elongation factor EF-G